MSLNHDCEVKINVWDAIEFSHHIGENYDLSEINFSTNASTGEVTVKYNVKMHYFLIDNIKHAAMAWNAAITHTRKTLVQTVKEAIYSEYN